jgi:predicted nucleic acid-binding protein
MGLILDSSVLVAAERQGQSARQALEAIAPKIGNVEIAISVLTVMELAHGVARANTPERQARRRQFVDDLMEPFRFIRLRRQSPYRLDFLTARARREAYGFPWPTCSLA